MTENGWSSIERNLHLFTYSYSYFYKSESIGNHGCIVFSVLLLCLVIANKHEILIFLET